MNNGGDDNRKSLEERVHLQALGDIAAAVVAEDDELLHLAVSS